jgi:predicted outer membrane repeat protein
VLKDDFSYTSAASASPLLFGLSQSGAIHLGANLLIAPTSSNGAAVSVLSGSAFLLDTVGTTTRSFIIQNYTPGGAFFDSAVSNLGKVLIGSHVVTQFLNNDASRGGAISNHGTYVSSGITHFRGNAATASVAGFGGAIYNWGGGSLTIANIVSFGDAETDGSGNTAQYGGAVVNDGYGSSLTLGTNAQDVTFHRNAATASGGAIQNSDQAALTILGSSRFGHNITPGSGNTASSGSGGAIYNVGVGSIATLGNATSTTEFYGNTSLVGNGGAIYNGDYASFNILGTAHFGSSSSTLGNTAASGGAIYNTEGGVVSLRTADFHRNVATSGEGGAIYNDGGGRITVSAAAAFGQNNQDSGNTASGDGGAIYNEGIGVPSLVSFLTTASFFRNVSTSSNGGAIANVGGEIDFTRALNFGSSAHAASGNTAKLNGGAIYNITGGTIKMSTNYARNFYRNVAMEGAGGAIYNDGGTVDIKGTQVLFGDAATTGTGNQAFLAGGAIYNAGIDGKVNLTTASFYRNASTSSNGGAIANAAGVVDFTQEVNFGSTANAASGNTAKLNGGAIYNIIGGTIQMSTDYARNFYRNVATDGAGGAIYNDGGTVDIKGTQVLFGDTVTTGTGNQAFLAGGAIYNTGIDGKVNITSTQSTGFYRNNVTGPGGQGGAISNTAGGEIKIANSGTSAYLGIRFGTSATGTGNSAEIGGAIYNAGTGSKITITQTSTGEVGFYGNTATQDGGAIYNGPYGDVTITSNASVYFGRILSGIFGNTAVESGGAIYNVGTLAITAGGGGLGIEAIGFFGSTAGNHGGAIKNTGSLLLTAPFINFGAEDAVGITGAGNQANQGGAIHSSGTVTLTGYSMFSNNAALQGGGYL